MPASRTFVPLEAWTYHSPYLSKEGRSIDVGLVAEALVMYDQVFVGFQSDEQFARLVAWFKGQGQLKSLVELLREAALVPYYFAFHTGPIHHDADDTWEVWNIQDEEAAQTSVFAKRVLNSGRLDGLVHKSEREALKDAALAHVVEVKSSDFGAMVENARLDYQTEDRAAVLVEMVTDEVYRDMGLLRAPRIECRIGRDGYKGTLTWNVDFRAIAVALGGKERFHTGTPLGGAAFGAKMLWAAALEGLDLYLAEPLTRYAAYKLGEGSAKGKTKVAIGELIERVEFPDIRALVNLNKLRISDVLVLRRKGQKFRNWLSAERDLERDAVHGYMGEFARDAGWTKNLGKVVSAVGALGGAAAGAALAGSLGAVGGAVTGEGIAYVLNLASRLDEGWKPVVFGNWAIAQVERAVAENRLRT